MNQQPWLKVAISTIVSVLGVNLILLQTGDPIIDYLGPVVPILGEVLKFFAQVLIPFGEIITSSIIEPILVFIPESNQNGLAIFFIIFAGIFILAMVLNVAWRPEGWRKVEED